MDVEMIQAYTIQGTENHLKKTLRARLAEEKRDFASILREKAEELAEKERYYTHPIAQYQRLSKF